MEFRWGVKPYVDSMPFLFFSGCPKKVGFFRARSMVVRKPSENWTPPKVYPLPTKARSR